MSESTCRTCEDPDAWSCPACARAEERERWEKYLNDEKARAISESDFSLAGALKEVLSRASEQRKPEGE